MLIESKFIKIRNLIKNSKHPIVFFDTDADGFTSYWQIKNTYPKAVGFPMGKDLQNQKYLIKHINEENDLIIFIDTPIISDELLEQLSAQKIIWADHHPNDNTEQIKKFNIIYLNPTMEYNTNLPGAYLAYKICNDTTNLGKAVMGSIADFFLQDIIIDLYKQEKKIYQTLLNINADKQKKIFDYIKKNIKNHTISRADKRDEYIRFLTFETNINIIRDFIESILRHKDDDEIISAIRKIEKLSIVEILQNINACQDDIYINFAKYQKLYKEKLKKALSSNYDDNLLFFTYSGKQGFSGSLSQEINYKVSSKVIAIAYRKSGKDFYTCSLRGRNYDVLKLLQYALEGLNAQGGGHKFAVGSAIHKNDFETFKQRIYDKTHQ